MKHLLILISGLLTCIFMYAQSGYNIAVQLKPYKNAYVYLGYHYGDVKALADSAMLDADSKGNFKGKEPLPGGIYFIVSPGKQILFEVLLDRDQEFTVIADSATLPFGVVFSGTTENQQFQEYSAFAGSTGQKIHALNEKLKSAKSKKIPPQSHHKQNPLPELCKGFGTVLLKNSPICFCRCFLMQ